MGNAQSHTRQQQSSGSTFGALRAEQFHKHTLRAEQDTIHQRRRAAEAKYAAPGSSRRRADADDDEDDESDVEAAEFLQRMLNGNGNGGDRARSSSQSKQPSPHFNNNNNNNKQSAHTRSNLLGGKRFFDAVQPLEFVPPVDRRHAQRHALSLSSPSAAGVAAASRNNNKDDDDDDDRDLPPSQSRRPPPPSRAADDGDVTSTAAEIYKLRPSLGRQQRSSSRSLSRVNNSNVTNNDNDSVNGAHGDSDLLTIAHGGGRSSLTAAGSLLTSDVTTADPDTAAATQFDNGDDDDDAADGVSNSSNKKPKAAMMFALGDVALPLTCDSEDVQHTIVDADFFATLKRCNELLQIEYSFLPVSELQDSSSSADDGGSFILVKTTPRQSNTKKKQQHQQTPEQRDTSIFHIFEDGRGCVPLLADAVQSLLHHQQSSFFSSSILNNFDDINDNAVDNLSVFSFLNEASALIENLHLVAAASSSSSSSATFFTFQPQCVRCPRCGLCSRHSAMCFCTNNKCGSGSGDFYSLPHSSSSTTSSSSSPSSSSTSAAFCALEAGPRWLVEMQQIDDDDILASVRANHVLSTSSSNSSSASRRRRQQQQRQRQSEEQGQDGFVSLFSLYGALLTSLLEASDLLDGLVCLFSANNNHNNHNQQQQQQESASPLLSKQDLLSVVNAAIAQMLEAAGVTTAVVTALSAMEWATGRAAGSVLASDVVFRFVPGSRIQFDCPVVRRTVFAPPAAAAAAATAISLLFPATTSTRTRAASSCRQSRCHHILSQFWSPELRRFRPSAGERNAGGGGNDDDDDDDADLLFDRTTRPAAARQRRSVAQALVFGTLQHLVVEQYGESGGRIAPLQICGGGDLGDAFGPLEEF